MNLRSATLQSQLLFKRAPLRRRLASFQKYYFHGV
jgi:hypothetical protein